MIENTSENKFLSERDILLQYIIRLNDNEKSFLYVFEISVLQFKYQSLNDIIETIMYHDDIKYNSYDILYVCEYRPTMRVYNKEYKEYIISTGNLRSYSNYMNYIKGLKQSRNNKEKVKLKGKIKRASNKKVKINEKFDI